jgi:NitT/TauT family transport system permease protein
MSDEIISAEAIRLESALAARRARIARVRRIALGVLGVLLTGAVWEFVKVIGGGKRRFGINTDDASMPHISTVLSRFGDAEVRGVGRSVFSAVLTASWYTFRLAVFGFILGTLIGLALAVVMTRFRLIERAWGPYVVLSQTVPLIALAPLIVNWGNQIKLGPINWAPWMTVTAMAAYLSFFPVAVGALRGLQSPKFQSLELMRSYAAGWWRTLFKLRFPSAIPFLIPAFKLAAAASVVGAIVAEISIGLAGGIGRLVLDYFQKATGDPAQVFTAFIGAAVLGLVVAGLVNLFEMIVMRSRPKEATA